jgi:hypothetical protein
MLRSAFLTPLLTRREGDWAWRLELVIACMQRVWNAFRLVFVDEIILSRYVSSPDERLDKWVWNPNIHILGEINRICLKNFISF